MPQASKLSTDDAIRARRRLTNKFIAAHEAQRLAPFFTADANLIGGEGGLISGAPAIVGAFAAQFSDPTFIAYERRPTEVTVDMDDARAAERGTWIGRWKDQTLTGDYLAVWRKVTGQWVIEQELYVTLAREG
jgi:ketosteroid isomerase-like protein